MRFGGLAGAQWMEGVFRGCLRERVREVCDEARGSGGVWAGGWECWVFRGLNALGVDPFLDGCLSTTACVVLGVFWIVPGFDGPV